MKPYLTTRDTEQNYLSLEHAAELRDDVLHLAAIGKLQEGWLRGVPYVLKPAHRRSFYSHGKRMLDVSASISILAAALPLMVILSLLVKLTSKGPIIFRHKRLGKDGVEFECFKFRTMVCDAEELLKNNGELQEQFREKFKIDNDPRVTRIGHFLRKTSLDELPQLIQVLQGKMTLIGPRPIVEAEVERYSIYANKLFSVTPGLSGLWQTSGRSDTSYKERVSLDMYYIDNRSLRLELWLIVMTVVTVLRKSGAY